MPLIQRAFVFLLFLATFTTLILFRTRRINHLETKRTDKNLTEHDRQCEENLKIYEQWCNANNINRTEGNLCACVSPNLVGKLNFFRSLNSSESSSWLKLKPGGEWFPEECTAIQKIAIIIPYRDRLSHLKILLTHLHPILKRQLHHYRIFVVEQSYPPLFNKATMMNAGFLEARKIYDFDCVIFHDVDILLEDDRGIYHCRDVPHHMGAYLNKFKYRLPYTRLIGGILGFQKRQFESLHGFSNKYFGWGGEDDNMARRIKKKKWNIYRFPKPNYHGIMIPHKRDGRNPHLKVPYTKDLPHSVDGLSSCSYDVKFIKNELLYTHIMVAIGTKNIIRRNYTVAAGDCKGNDILRFPFKEIEECKLMCDVIHQHCVSFVSSKTMCFFKKEILPI